MAFAGSARRFALPEQRLILCERTSFESLFVEP